MRNHEWMKNLGCWGSTEQMIPWALFAFDPSSSREDVLAVSWRLGWIMLAMALPMRSKVFRPSFAWYLTQAASCFFWGAWGYNEPRGDVQKPCEKIERLKEQR